MRITRVPPEGLLLYDDDCGPCTRCARWFVGRGARPAVVAMSRADAEALGFDADRATRQIPLLRDDGHGGTRVLWGADAISACLATCRFPVNVLGRLIGSAPVRPVAAAVYRLVAQNRHRLPGSAACRR